MPLLRLPQTPVNRILSSIALPSALPSLSTCHRGSNSGSRLLCSAKVDGFEGVAGKEHDVEGGSAGLKKIGFGFSAGGLVFPYLVGVSEGLRESGLLTSEWSLVHWGAKWQIFCLDELVLKCRVWSPILHGCGILGNVLGVWHHEMAQETVLSGCTICILQ